MPVRGASVFPFFAMPHLVMTASLPLDRINRYKHGLSLAGATLMNIDTMDISTMDRDLIDDEENPELTVADFAKAKPFKDMFPEQYKTWKRLGRPPVEAPKIHVGFRLAPDMVNGIRATGRGYNARVERVLCEILAKGQI